MSCGSGAQIEPVKGKASNKHDRARAPGTGGADGSLPKQCKRIEGGRLTDMETKGKRARWPSMAAAPREPDHVSHQKHCRSRKRVRFASVHEEDSVDTQSLCQSEVPDGVVYDSKTSAGEREQHETGDGPEAARPPTLKSLRDITTTQTQMLPETRDQEPTGLTSTPSEVARANGALGVDAVESNP